MSKNLPPAPPPTDNPIYFLREIAPRNARDELAFVDTLLSAYEERAVDRAAKCVASALSAGMEWKILDAMVGAVNQLAYKADCYPDSLKAMLCLAVDAGFHKYSYNAANLIFHDAKCADDFKNAERYYKLAMAFDDEPRTQAAAHVNYCAIVRDGLISGSPDWPAAVEIYETAARMGLIKAMFNAGNVSAWMANQGDRGYGARAAYWFKYALDYRAAGNKSLDMESAEELEAVFDSCIQGLSGLHIDGRFDGADLAEGIRLAKGLAERGSLDARHNLSVGYTQRLARLDAKPKKSPGANWRSVLSQMDWRFDDSIRKRVISIPAARQTTEMTKLDELTVKLTDGSQIPIFVSHWPCLPLFGGMDLIRDIAVELAGYDLEQFFLLPRKALFIQSEQHSYTPIYVFQNKQISVQSLWLGGSPDLLLQHARDQVGFLDERFGNWHCMLPIAANVLDEGFVVAEHGDFGLPWVGVGEPWRMPFFDKHKLPALGINIEM